MELGKLVDPFAALEAQQVAYVLVGGVAVNLHGLVRATDDVALFVRSDPENIARLKRALRSVWDDAAIDEIQASDVEDYAVVRYGPPDEEFVVDVIARIGTETSWEDLGAEEIAFQGVPVRLATPATLYRMKRGTSRPVDQADARNLREKFGLEEREESVPVERFRTFEEARRGSWLEPGDPRLARRMAWVFAWSREMSRGEHPRGVQRFRTLGDANAERERRVQLRVERLRAERRPAATPAGESSTG